MSKRLIENFRDFNSGELVKKTIMNIFICEYSHPLWKECVSIFKSLSFPTSVQISGAHHRGLAFQILLDTNLEESIESSIPGRYFDQLVKGGKTGLFIFR